jgi:hypothetical protein
MANQNKEPQEQAATGESPKDVLARLDRLERTTGRSGAVPNAPKQQMLDLSDLKAKHPDKHLRWGTLANPEKMQSRLADGYERLSAADGGKQLGNLVVLALPRAEAERRIKDLEAKHKERLEAHNREVEAAAEATAKYLRDNYGFSVKPEEIIVRG